MNLTRPTQVRALLDELGIHPSRALGQNFLIDANVLRILVDAADLTSADHVLEVGPGLGVLTQELAARAGQLVAVEKDHRLAAYLTGTFANSETVEIITGDMLKQRFDDLGGGALTKVVANLPYRPGTRILVDLVRSAVPPERMVLTVQREVADRLVAKAGAAEYGLLSAWVGRLYDTELVKVVSPTCFWPAPAVTSAIVRLMRHDRQRLPSEVEARFYALTRYAFTYRRKQLAGLLHKAPADLRMDEHACRDWLAGRGVAETARPEALCAEDWCELTARISGKFPT